MEVTQFIANKEDRSYFDSLVENLKKCSEFKMSVAFIIGSSNKTQRALKTNQEWNLLQSENCWPENHEPGYFAKSVLNIWRNS